jgi:mannose-1-phosphate guanylyltransferase
MRLINIIKDSNLIDTYSNLIDTYSNLINTNNKIYIVCNIEILSTIEDQLNGLFKNGIIKINNNIKITIITEPCSKGTGASICISSLLDSENKNKISFILPSDHIFNEDEFINCCIKSFEYKDNCEHEHKDDCEHEHKDDCEFEHEDKGEYKYINNNIVTIGIKVSNPELNYGYGYIKIKNNKLDLDYIEKFIEKPNSNDTYKSTEYLWNSGIYIFKNKNVLDCYNKYSNDIYKCCKRVYDDSFIDTNKIVKDNYSIIHLQIKHYYNCRYTSFDFSIMEYLIRDHNKSINGICIKYNHFWDDIGYLCVKQTI